MKLSSSKSRAIDNGTLHIPETRLKMRGCPPWRSLIFTGERAYVSKGVASQDHLAISEELNSGGIDRVLYITCPKCTATKWFSMMFYTTIRVFALSFVLAANAPHVPEAGNVFVPSLSCGFSAPCTRESVFPYASLCSPLHQHMR